MQGMASNARMADRVLSSVPPSEPMPDNLVLLAEMTEKRITEAQMLGDNIWASLVGPSPGSDCEKTAQPPSLSAAMERNLQRLNELVAHLTNIRIKVSG